MNIYDVLIALIQAIFWVAIVLLIVQCNCNCIV